MNAFTLEFLVDRAGIDVSLDLIGMFLSNNDLIRMVIISVTCYRRLARRSWLIVDIGGESSGTVTIL